MNPVFLVEEVLKDNGGKYSKQAAQSKEATCHEYAFPQSPISLQK